MATRTVLAVLVLAVSAGHAQEAVRVTEGDQLVVLDNGIVAASVAKASGDLVSLRYKGQEVLATFLKEDGTPDLEKDPPGENRAGLNRGMTDHQYGFWSHDAMGPRGTGDAVSRITIDPKTNGGERAEVSVKGISNGRLMGTGPGAGQNGNFLADVEIRWSLGRGDSGVYTYCTFEHKPEYAASSITEARFCAKLADFFDWMSVAQDEHHNKHYPASLQEGDKYVYTTNQYKNPAFGWSSTTRKLGFFLINPSMEYMSGGPTKIEFLGHRDTNRVAAPCVLNYWRSSHYGGAEVAVAAGEHWVKVIGPFMLYVNSGSDAQGLYKDARDQAAKEQQKWPFSWVQGVDYPLGGQRATVQGQLVLSDSVVPSAKMSNVLVGLTAPAYTSSAPGFGGVGRQVDWQQDAKHYQFWVRGTDAGVFRIPDVRAGTYTLHAFADGVLGELVRPGVTVEAGKPLDLGKVVWTPVRRGRPVWEVGIPNRSGSEFFKGDVYYTPNITASYSRLFPQDITYVIGKSEMAKDWFFAHVPYADPNAPAPAAGGGFFMRPVNGRACPRTIVFTLSNKGRGRATLRAAFSGTGVRSIAVAVNDAPVGQFSNLPTDGVLSSHGMHGVWHEQEFVFDGSLLKQGENQVTLTVPAGGVNSGVIYDVLRLELDEAAQPPAAGRPVTPDAAPEAVALLRFFYDLSGRHTLTGQHNYPGDQDRHTLAAAKAWGKTPAVFGKDWGFARQGDKDSAYVRGEIVEELKAQYRNGAIVTMCWHEVPPTADEPVTFQGRRGEPVQGDLNTVQGRLTDAQYKDLLTPGTELHRRWCAQVDAIVPHFKKLEEARVPLLWRPFHEMNGTWFWWGGRKGEHGTAELYKMMFNRLVQHHKIKNLIWVWSVDRPEGTSLRFEECWPGPEYVDILSLDCYSEFKQSYYDDLMRLAAGKPIALAEVGAAPSLEVLAQQPNWTWWMTWAGMAQGRGPEGAAAVRTLVHDPRSWSLSDAEYRKAVAPMRLASNLPADSPVPPSP